MNVLSLFDGMSCGQIALERAGIEYDNYFASEIDKYAIQVTKHNYQNTKHIGDVTQVKGADLPRIDLLIGGSPCQGFSFAGKQLNFNDPRSKLFFEFVRLLEETKPKYFLLENVIMKKEYQDIISKYLGVEPVEIDSSMVSAQKRRRLYWANFKITQPDDRDINLEDIIDFNVRNYRVPTNFQRYVPDDMPQFVDPYNRREIRNKSTSLRTNVNNGNMWVKVPDGYRNLTVGECELLQNIPSGYTSCISEAQAKKQMGNGWTVDVIAHIFKCLLNENL